MVYQAIILRGGSWTLILKWIITQIRVKMSTNCPRLYKQNNSKNPNYPSVVSPLYLLQIFFSLSPPSLFSSVSSLAYTDCHWTVEMSDRISIATEHTDAHKHTSSIHCSFAYDHPQLVGRLKTSKSLIVLICLLPRRYLWMSRLLVSLLHSILRSDVHPSFWTFSPIHK